MQRLPIVALCALLAACAGVKKYLPAGPVMSLEERAAFASAPAGVDYLSEPAVPFPVVPVQVWGVSYDLDLVLESTHERYDMHEYARVQTPEGPVWMAKDALSATKTQSIVADLDDLATWVPEMAVERKIYPVEVDDRSTDDWLDIDLRYENLAGEPVEIHYEGKPPQSLQKKRNGNTMGHSANVAMAVLNIPYRDFGKRASVRIDGEDYKIRKLLGLVKLQVVLVQTQGGLSVTSFQQSGNADGFSSVVGPGERDIDQAWVVEDRGETLSVRQQEPFRTLSYTYQKNGESLELSQMQVEQFGYDAPIVTIDLSPALPDVRRRFEGRHISRFVVDVDDQKGHAFGRLEAFWEGDAVKVLLHPDEPEWVTDRPMETTISYAKIEPEPAPEPKPKPGPVEEGATDGDNAEGAPAAVPEPTQEPAPTTWTADVSIARVPVAE